MIVYIWASILISFFFLPAFFFLYLSHLHYFLLNFTECDIRSCLNTLQFLNKKKEALNVVGPLCHLMVLNTFIKKSSTVTGRGLANLNNFKKEAKGLRFVKDAAC